VTKGGGQIQECPSESQTVSPEGDDYEQGVNN
jgi:hypothetical protein